jgi:hypothetical protein
MFRVRLDPDGMATVRLIVVREAHERAGGRDHT